MSRLFGSRGRRRGSLRRVTRVVAAGATAVVLVAAPGAVSSVKSAPAVPPASLGPAVTGLTRIVPTPSKLDDPARTSAKATGTMWPAAANGTVTLDTSAAPAATPTRADYAGTTPVWVQSLADAGGSTHAASPAAAAAGAGAPLTSVAVSVLPHSAAAAAGIDGVIATLTPTGSGRAQIGLDYSSFAQIYGGDYGPGLRLVELPACVATTPTVAACRIETPLASGANDVAKQQVSATLAFPAATQTAKTAQTAQTAQTPRIVVAAVPADSGSGSADGGGTAGQYGATSLKPSGSWAQGGDTGGFDYSYPMTVPASSSPLAPDVDLSYDSQSVDGQTASTQAQSSWIGDGWSTADSYIEQSFVSCAEDPEGTVLPAASATGDECYDGPVLTMSLDGVSTSLVWDSTQNLWKAQDDTGDLITQVNGSVFGPGSDSSSYWQVTERDGTVYDFGINQLPGWAAGDPTTNSVDTQPVYSANPGDPCYNSAGFTSSVCATAYRWHLDYVQDLNKNAMAYFYDQATNYYGQDDGAKNASYVRDSYLDHIDYGFNLNSSNAYGTVPDKIVFDTGDRCVSGTCDPLSAGTAANWQDVPFTDVCAAGATCPEYSPSYFSTVRLASVTTEQWNGSSYAPVDSYTLTQTMPSPGDGTSATLWLSSISHTGDDTSAGGSVATLPTVTFAGTAMANRVNLVDGLPALNRFRISQILTETGSKITVDYGLPDPCNASSLPAPSTNTASCYPEEWTPAGYTAPITDWFNVYAVTSVAQSDPTGGSGGLYSAYTYNGGAAWHFDDDELVQSKYRTWGQFRGYASVVTTTGTGLDPVTASQTWYYRGMDGDWLNTAGSSTRPVVLTDTAGGTHTDADQLAGDVLETAAYTNDVAPLTIDHATISSYWVSAATASRQRPAQGTAYAALPALTANATGEVESWSTQALTDGGATTWRTTETDTGYDATVGDADFGLPLYVYSHGDLSLENGSSSQATCTITTYAPANVKENLAGLVAETQTDDKPCSGATADPSSAPTAAQTNDLSGPAGLDLTTDVVSDTRTFYDDQAMATTWPQPAAPAWPQDAPALGDASVVQVANGVSGGKLTYQTKSASVFGDEYGRATVTYDGDGNKTGTAYTTNSVGLTTAMTVTNAANQSSSQALDPTRGLTVSSTDPNGVVTTVWYDGLGRTIDVWDDSRSTGVTANNAYSYAVSDTNPSVVTTQTLNDNGGTTTSETLYDALDRVRQTQAPTPDGGRLISDTVYDTHGWTARANADYWDPTTAPNSTLMSVPDDQVADQTQTSYDGLGRPTVVSVYDDAVLKSTAYSQYTGDETISVPPTGGTAQATVTDALGRTSALEQFTAAPTVSTATVGGFTLASVGGESAATTQTTSYTFDAQGRPYKTIDPAGDKYATGYNFLGQVDSTTDPDTGGITGETYDADGNVLSITDEAGDTMSTVYDALGRKTRVYDGPTATQSPSDLAASYTYDGPGVADSIGQMTGESSYNVAYSNGTPSSTLVESVAQSGFNVFGESLGTTYTIAGPGSLAGSYKYTYGYTSTTGLPKNTEYPAVGAMPAELVTTAYKQFGEFVLPNTLGGNTASGTSGYLNSLAYTALGQVSTQTLGSGGSGEATVSNSYDPTTGALTDTRIAGNGASTPIDDTSYGYDADQQLTSQTDVREGTETETQCYGYDALDRLTQAWTTASTASSCATTPTATNVGATVGDGIPGSAYWTSWTFGESSTSRSQPASMDQHALTSGGTDTTTTYAYNGAGTGQVDTVTGTSTQGPSGTTTAAYTYNALGQTVTRPNAGGQTETLGWNTQGALATVGTTGGGTTTYLYGADGNVLEQQSPANTTLYLPDQDVVLTGSTLSCTRYYALPGGGEAVRTSANAYDYVLQNPQGTGTLQLSATFTDPVWEQQTPYGAPRGAAAAGWTDPRGFLDKAQDTADDLTIVGAREYDTTLGAFVSADPVTETNDPEQLGGYQYAGNDPVSASDPSGDTRTCGYGCGTPNPVTSCLEGPYAPGSPCNLPGDGSGSGSGSGSGAGSGSSGTNSGSGSNKGTANTSDAGTSSQNTGCFSSWSNFFGCGEHVGSDVVHAAPAIIVGAVIVIGATVCVVATDGACIAAIMGAGDLDGLMSAGYACATSICSGFVGAGLGSVFGAPGMDDPYVGPTRDMYPEGYVPEPPLPGEGVRLPSGIYEGPGRPDGQQVLAGHGTYDPANGGTVVPDGTSLVFSGKDRPSIPDAFGNMLESNGGDIEATRVFGPGSVVPNLTLLPTRGDLALMGSSTLVGEPTLLSDLLEPNMGIVHWAACTGSAFC